MAGVWVNVELKGDEMGVLIGKRGQTLDSLQYLTSLALNRHTDEYVKVKLDTEDYAVQPAAFGRAALHAGQPDLNFAKGAVL